MPFMNNIYLLPDLLRIQFLKFASSCIKFRVSPVKLRLPPVKLRV